ncbi:hypothetical protein HZA33_03170 [Candidatus Pacearchaeota archaeon]|nr:hypothetical protein [Candidatus Pacearchaeota archaeon]
MTKTIDMLFMQYIAFFERIIGVRTKHCFSYNGTIFFVVQPEFLARAIGENGLNVRKLAEKLRKKIKIISTPDGSQDIQKFISSVVYPIQFKRATFNDEEKEVTIEAPLQSRAMLIGRNKKKQEELLKILEDYFGAKKLKIVNG